MTTKLTLFTAILVQDSALSISGLDRETSADQAFTLVDGVPTLVGRGLKGAAVAMAKRFFDPLPRVISDETRNGALRRSAWEFADAVTTATSMLRAGVGIRQQTGARAGGVLYDREVIPAGTRWQLNFRVDSSQTNDAAEFAEAEGILGYVLAEHWAKDRCWLGGGAARGLGWCHLEELKAYRLDQAAYNRWIASGRTDLPPAQATVPTVAPTRAWCFRTLDVDIAFGEYQPESDAAAWGLDMLAIGPHGSEQATQPTGDGDWARPTWASDAELPATINTDRALLMAGQNKQARPLLPGSSVRGPLRHAYSRLERAAGNKVSDPTQKGVQVADNDPGAEAFGTVQQSSRILIRDAHALGTWAAAKLHMHAEDEFSASTFGTSKRDAVRLLRGTFPVQIVIEGASEDEVKPLQQLIDRQVALGTLGHLLIGGDKTRGAGAGHWRAKAWRNDDVAKMRSWAEQPKAEANEKQAPQAAKFPVQLPVHAAFIKTECGQITEPLSLGAAARLAQAALGDALLAWWCEPAIDLDLHRPPATFGCDWPSQDDPLTLDEVIFFAERAAWRGARTVGGTRFVLMQEQPSATDGAQPVQVVHTPVRLHNFKRFAAADTGAGSVQLREWHQGGELLGYTITEEKH